MKIDDNKISNLLPIGYLFLVVLGLIKESLIYNQIGINILSYSSITDILISPIVTLTNNFILFPVIIVFAFIMYYGILVHPIKNRDKKWVKKSINNRNKDFWERSDKKIKADLFNLYWVMLIVFISAVYVGTGLKKGQSISQDINNNDLEYQHSLTYIYSDKTVKISLIGANSVNYFYVEKGENNVKISPVTAIKSLEKLNDEKDREGKKSTAVNNKINKTYKI